MVEATDNAKRLQESTDLLQRLLDEEAVSESDRPELAVQIVYNREALASANEMNERLAEALRPFVKAFHAKVQAPRQAQVRRDWNEEMPGEWPIELTVTMEDGRRARALLQSIPNKGESK